MPSSPIQHGDVAQIPDVHYGYNAAFDEWVDHLPLSLIDLFGIKTYDSVLPFNIRPHYLFYGEQSPNEILGNFSGGR